MVDIKGKLSNYINDMSNIKKRLRLRQITYLIFLCASFSVCANTTEEDISSTIRFQGSVINPAPVWTWQIDPSAVSWARDWNINYKQGVESEQFITFSYTDGKGSRRQSFLQGFMKTPSEQTSPNIVPIVSITDKNNQRIILNGNTEPQDIELKAEGDAGNVIGTMQLSLESAYSVFYKKVSEPGVYYRTWLNDSAGIGFAAQSVIIKYQPKLYDYYPTSLRQIILRQNINYDMIALLNGSLIPEAYDLLGGFTSHMSKVKTIWPRHHIPSTWQATLTVDVQIP